MTPEDILREMRARGLTDDRPYVLVDGTKLEPADGVVNGEPGKIWYIKEDNMYVQHLSGTGKKYQVQDNDTCWNVKGRPLLLPKDEYLRCDPPKEWRDIQSATFFEGRQLQFDKHTWCLPEGFRFVTIPRIAKEYDCA